METIFIDVVNDYQPDYHYNLAIEADVTFAHKTRNLFRWAAENGKEEYLKILLDWDNVPYANTMGWMNNLEVNPKIFALIKTKPRFSGINCNPIPNKELCYISIPLDSSSISPPVGVIRRKRANAFKVSALEPVAMPWGDR